MSLYQTLATVGEAAGRKALVQSQTTVRGVRAERLQLNSIAAAFETRGRCFWVEE